MIWFKLRNQKHVLENNHTCGLVIYEVSNFCGSGVSLLARDSMGCTALHLAARHGHTDVVSFILEHGECQEYHRAHAHVFAYSKFMDCLSHQLSIIHVSVRTETEKAINVQKVLRLQK